MEAIEQFYELVASRAEQRGKQRLESDLHRTWEQATYRYLDVGYSPEIIMRVYFMHYAATFVHPEEEPNTILDQWLAKP